MAPVPDALLPEAIQALHVDAHAHRKVLCHRTICFQHLLHLPAVHGWANTFPQAVNGVIQQPAQLHLQASGQVLESVMCNNKVSAQSDLFRFDHLKIFRIWTILSFLQLGCKSW